MKNKKILTALFLIEIELILLILVQFSEATKCQSDGYKIVINSKKRELTLYCGEEKIKTYSVAVPQESIKKKFGLGKVDLIQYNPWWYPTESIRQEYLEKKGIKLPKAVPPNHPLNAMGKVKIHLSYTHKGMKIYRIHGTNDPSMIGRPVTHGCYRMCNSDVLELVQYIKKGTLVMVE